MSAHIADKTKSSTQFEFKLPSTAVHTFFLFISNKNRKAWRPLDCCGKGKVYRVQWKYKSTASGAWHQGDSYKGVKTTYAPCGVRAWGRRAGTCLQSEPLNIPPNLPACLMTVEPAVCWHMHALDWSALLRCAPNLLAFPAFSANNKTAFSIFHVWN